MGMSAVRRSFSMAQAKQLKTSPTAGSVREGAYTTTGINIIHRSFNQQTEKSFLRVEKAFFVT